MRLTGSHSSTLLEQANQKFTRRFQRLEKLCVERGFLFEEVTLEELNAIWEDIKREERD